MCSDSDCSKTLMSTVSATYTPKLHVAKALAVWEDFDSDGFCDPCREDGQVNFEQGRENLWKNLPFVFGLPSWDVLEVTLDEAD